MTKLFISADLDADTSGDMVASKEFEFIQSLDDSVTYLGRSTPDVIKLDFNDIHPTRNNLYDIPFLIDYLTMERLSKIDLSKISLAHMYGDCFTQTIRLLKSKGIKTTLTSMFHDRYISIHEFENIFGKNSFPFKHMTDDKLWNLYIGGIREADIVITGGKAPKNSIMKENPGSKVEIIPHGCNIPNLDQIKPFPEEFRVGYLGAFGSDKGIRYLIEAWSSLNYKDSTLLFAGRGSENLEQLISRFAKTGKFNLSGYIQHPQDLYNRISVYVQPSTTEGFGMETIEAMSYGRPAIVSDGAGSADCITDEKDGFVVTKMNYKAISEKINWFKKNPEKIIEMGKNAREKSFNYSWNKIKEKYINVWTKLLNE